MCWISPAPKAPHICHLKYPIPYHMPHSLCILTYKNFHMKYFMHNYTHSRYKNRADVELSYMYKSIKALHGQKWVELWIVVMSISGDWMWISIIEREFVSLLLYNIILLTNWGTHVAKNLIIALGYSNTCSMGKDLNKQVNLTRFTVR